MRDKIFLIYYYNLKIFYKIIVVLLLMLCLQFEALTVALSLVYCNVKTIIKIKPINIMPFSNYAVSHGIVIM